MTDKELFLKYNFIDSTLGLSKNEILEGNYYYDPNHPLENIEYPSGQWVILLQTTYDCNANCVYCENEELREKYHHAVMPKEIIQQVIEKLGPNISNITFHGGEPLLLSDDYFSFTREIIDKNGYNIEIQLQTNGILLTPEKEKMLNNLNIMYGTSFDGLSNTLQRGADSTKAILKLLARDPNLSCIGVITKNNINNLIDNYEYLKNLGFKSMQSAVVAEKFLKNTNEYLADNNIVIEKILEYVNYWMYDLNNPIEDHYINRRIEQLLGKSTVCEDIFCGCRWLVIDPLGNISFCGAYPKEINFGNINDITCYQDITTNPLYINVILKEISLVLQECKDCSYVDCCYGGCMALNYIYDNNFEHINQRNCKLTKGILDGIYELIKDIDILDEKYNPFFINLLKNNNYFSLTEIKSLEKENNNA